MPPNNESNDHETTEAPGEAALLVSEFPPPPFYYRQSGLTPPPIPTDALTLGTQRAAAAAARARAEAERLRLGDNAQNENGNNGNDATSTNNAILGGVAAVPEEDNADGNVVAVFGEIVEDPLLVEPLDRCDDPTVVRDEVKRLNENVLERFVKLVQDLVHNPLENKVTRDDLSHNIFLMLQETNKFREHQARELLIEVLEKQLEKRNAFILELQENIDDADKILNSEHGGN